MIALAAGAFGAEELMQASNWHSRVAALQANLDTLQSRLAADERAEAGERVYMRGVSARATSAQRALTGVSWELQSLPTEAEVARMRAELSTYATCVPQLQSEFDGLAFNWRIDPGKPSADYFKLFTTAPMSASCAAVLTGR